MDTISPSSSTTTRALTFYDFLDRMRNPASLDLVRSIKSFIVSFSFCTTTSENDGKRIQDFFLTMEVSIRDHPLWTNATEEEIDSAIEGLEKYVMTKLFSRTFAASPEDGKIDQEVSEKICLLQNFLRPEHLDIPAIFQNEASWLLAEKELQKINAFRAPREKLLCILSCCRANPPQLHSNLKFIQLFRRQAKLVSEAAYYLTNLVSVKSFIVDLDAKSLSMDESDFQESMHAARLASKVTQMGPSHELDETAALPIPPTRMLSKAKHTEPSAALNEIAALAGQTDPELSKSMWDKLTDITGGPSYPFMEAEAGELTIGDVERLLSLYKSVVKKYTSLCKAVRSFSLPKLETAVPHLERTDVLAQPKEQIKLDQKLGE